MKKSTFLHGAIVASMSYIIVKVIGVLYVIPFNAIIGEDGGALYSFGYNIYAVFLSISSAGIPFAMAKIIGEYNALGYENAKEKAYKVGRNILIALSIVAFGIMFIFANGFARFMIGDNAVTTSAEDVAFVIRCISFAILVIPFLSVTKGYLQGHKFITPISASQIIEQLVRVAVILIGSYVFMLVLNLGLRLTIGVSMLGAGLGGLVAVLYLRRKLTKGKAHFICENKSDDSHITSKEILKKILVYSVPFIITSVATNIYIFANMVLLVRTMGDILHYDPEITTTVTAVYSTWGSKLLLIVISFTAGISMSFLPNIVDSYARGNIQDISNKYNKALQIIFIFIVPLTIFLGIFAEEVWTLFYGESEYGPLIFKVYIYVAITNSLFALVNNLAQGMNKFKMVYILTGIGIGLNILLAVPFMLLMEWIGTEVVYGAIFASIISMGLAFIIATIYFRKKEGFDYSETIKLMPKIILGIIVFIGVSILAKEFVPLEFNSRIMQIVSLGVYGAITFGIYAGVSFILGTLKVAFSKEEKLKM